MTFLISFGGRFAFQVKFNEPDWVALGGQEWCWFLRIGKWQRGEGIKLLKEAKQYVTLEYWERKDEHVTHWVLRSPYYKYER